jgi:hypothetical protein
MIVFYLPYSVKILALEDMPSHPEVSVQPWTFVDCYRIWNNPRALPGRYTAVLGKEESPEKKRPLQSSGQVFTLYRVSKMAALWAFDSLVFQRLLIAAFTNVTAADFAPHMEFLPLDRLLNMSAHEFRVRSIMSVQWIWSAYFFLEFYHCLLSIIFVSILRFDKPEEWPALFGSPLEASTVRGFWAKFWHRLTVPTYTHYALLISRKALGMRAGSRAEKTVVPMCIFLFAGLSHSLVGWAMGDAALSRDVLFCVVNFAAAAVEVAVSKALKGDTQARWPLPRIPAPLQKSLGLAGVFLFFFSVVPMWMYPKVYPSILAAQAQQFQFL